MSSESPPTLETAECEKLLDTLLNSARTAKQKRKAVRNHCMALLMLDAGLRVGELVSLRLSDLYFSWVPVRTIFIKPHMTKNKLEHHIPVSNRLSKVLKSYGETWNLMNPDRGVFFAFANDSSNRPLTTRQVERIICSAGCKALGRPVHPHILRHTAASRWMRVTNDSVVQQLLGHKYLTSTQVYCHPNSDDLRQAIDKATVQPVQEPSSDQHQEKQTASQEVQRPGPVPASPSKSPQVSRW